LHVLVAPEPVAATVLDSEKVRGLVVIASSTVTSATHMMFVRLVVLTVIVRVTVIVAPTAVKAAASGPSEAAGETGRNVPVFGSRYPRMPGFDGLFASWLQAAGATMRQHMEINNSLVILILSPSGFQESVG
jgi:hypothetical protein